ncbi:MAG TPA: MgtC/SapB family protein [Candidatus Paceibacterota bacterium]|nr:MgtC/SapB family protein [Candidatus Paceibacterota bacterium]
MHGAAQFIDPTNVIFIKLLLAMVLGGLIGTERAVLARQAAGTRTFGLVALGACLFVIVGSYVDTAYLGVINFDPMHIAAAIVTGIGFIGGGLIIFHRESLHGVTTAAGLWIVAALGMAIGFGMFAVAIFTTILSLVMLVGMWYVEDRFKHWFNTPEERDNHGASAL